LSADPADAGRKGRKLWIGFPRLSPGNCLMKRHPKKQVQAPPESVVAGPCFFVMDGFPAALSPDQIIGQVKKINLMYKGRDLF
jgi:hypothetical protein